MTICGYSNEMGKGLRILFSAMFDVIDEKAKNEGVKFGDILERELLEIPEINRQLSPSTNFSHKMFMGLNIMALSHFTEIHARLTVDASNTKHLFMDAVDKFIATLEDAENYSLSVPLNDSLVESQIQERASDIGKWIYTNLK